MTHEAEFADLEVNIEPADQDLVVSSWVAANLSPASNYVFKRDTEINLLTVQEALYHAVFNDVVLSILEEQLAAAKTSETPAN